MEASAVVKSVNPDWTRDELILALNVYLRWAGNPPGKNSPEIGSLSGTIKMIQLSLGAAPTETLRNVNGAYMKIMNFRRFDPAYQSQGKKGLSRGNRLEEEVWRLFSADRERLAQVAYSIESAVASGEVQDSVAIAESLDIEALEGRILTVLHRQRERSRKLVERKKQQVQEVEGRLACEACAFDFAQRYGERGRGFIECHHTKAIETLGDGKPTRLSDLALLCSNCHRMIHSKRPWLSLPELKALVR